MLPRMSASRTVGTITRARGRAVDVALAQGVDLGVGEQLDVQGATLGVIARLDERALRCVAVTGAPFEGQEVAYGGRAWTKAIDARATNQLAEALTPERASYRDVLETGLKPIDFLCPLRAGGSLVLLGGPSVAKTLLPTELAMRLGQQSAQQIHVPLASPLPSSLRELRKQCVQEGLSPFDQINDVELLWMPMSDAADPGYASGSAGSAFDSVVYLSASSAVRGLYPCVDPVHSGSRALREGWVDREHVETHRAYLRALARYRELTSDLLFWELLAHGARAAAGARWTEVETSALHRASSSDAQLMHRVRKIERYLTQPFHCATPFTGLPGAAVPRGETVRTVAAILRGDFDHVDAQALYMKNAVAPH